MAIHAGTRSSHQGARRPQGRTSSRTSTITAPSITTVPALASRSTKEWSSRGLPGGMPTGLPATQAVFSVRYGRQARTASQAAARSVRPGTAGTRGREVS
ncbi:MULTISPECIES: hypothetical protein [Streptomyces]|uniref:hypothetical protein n=1 Tax=Streptomyces TaxID=1883 RepID=UPI001F14F5AB|nr:hypothetical protein [Streptomyces sp. ADI98-12]